jgi:hypothetical protein
VIPKLIAIFTLLGFAGVTVWAMLGFPIFWSSSERTPAQLPRNPKTHSIHRAREARKQLEDYVAKQQEFETSWRDICGRIQKLEKHTEELKAWVEKNKGKPGFTTRPTQLLNYPPENNA